MVDIPLPEARIGLSLAPAFVFLAGLRLENKAARPRVWIEQVGLPLENGGASQGLGRGNRREVFAGSACADDVEVDVSTHAWKVAYADAVGSARETTLEGVRVPFLSLSSLIANKDAWDRVRLLELQKRQAGGSQ